MWFEVGTTNGTRRRQSLATETWRAGAMPKSTSRSTGFAREPSSSPSRGFMVQLSSQWQLKWLQTISCTRRKVETMDRVLFTWHKGAGLNFLPSISIVLSPPHLAPVSVPGINRAGHQRPKDATTQFWESTGISEAQDLKTTRQPVPS